MRIHRTRQMPFGILLGLMLPAIFIANANSPAWALTFAANEKVNLPSDQVIADS